MDIVGQIFARYRITQKIGEGGMAEVYAATHELMGREAAVKLLLPHMSTNENIVKRFFQEAQAAARIRHPGIVGVFDVGYSSDGRGYIVMEKLAGETLNERLTRMTTLPLNVTIQLMRQLASVISAAHDQGIVHRDLKPDNIFLVPDEAVEGGERVKVLDFGLAKLAEHVGTALTAQGMVFGTPAYMAPEQCRDAGKVDERADLYAIGCIMYRCLCGKTPFVGSGLDILSAQIRTPPVPPRNVVASIPPAINALIMRLLEKSPEQRVRSCADLLAALNMGAVPADDTLVHENDASSEVTLMESRPHGVAFAPEPTTDVDAEPVPLPGVARQRAPQVVDESDEATMFTTASGPAIDITAAGRQGATLSGDTINGATIDRNMAPAMDRPATGRTHGNTAPQFLDNVATTPHPSGTGGDSHPGAGHQPAPKSRPPKAGQASAPRRTNSRAWLIWIAPGLVIAGVIAVVLALGATRDEPAPAPRGVEPGVVKPGKATTSVTKEFDEYTARAQEFLDRQEWRQALEETERAIRFADENNLDDPDRRNWVERLHKMATEELHYQTTYHRFEVAQKAGDIESAVASYGELPPDSTYRETARPAYETMRDSWLDKVRSQARHRAREGACDKLDDILEKVDMLFPDQTAGFEGFDRQCEQRRSENLDPEVRQQKRDTLMAESRGAYRGGDYRRAYSACRKAYKLAPGDQEIAMLCGSVACKIGNAGAAKRYYASLSGKGQRALAKFCSAQNVPIKQ